MKTNQKICEDNGKNEEENFTEMNFRHFLSRCDSQKKIKIEGKTIPSQLDESK